MCGQAARPSNPLEDVAASRPGIARIVVLVAVQSQSLPTGLVGRHIHPPVVPGAGSGMRLGETLALPWTYTESDGRVVSVERTIALSIALYVYTRAVPEIQQQAADVVGEKLAEALGDDRVSGYNFGPLGTAGYKTRYNSAQAPGVNLKKIK